MSKFLVKLIVFLLPFAVVSVLPIGVLLVSGEATPISDVVRKQASADRLVLFGPAYSNSAMYLKFQSVLARRPEVIVLGTSRVMQFRSKFFKDDVRFYNAGGGVERINHFRQFLDFIPKGQEPKIIIVGLDQYFFNPNWDDLSEDGIKTRLTTGDQPDLLGMFTSNWLKIYQDYFNGKYAFADLGTVTEDLTTIGLNARTNRTGFRNDGSYDYGAHLVGPHDLRSEDYEYRNTLERISKGNARFEYGSSISPKAVEELRLFLEACKFRGIYVIGFLPPYAKAIYDRLISLPEAYAYLPQVRPSLQSVFEEMNYGLFDFSDITSVGAPDAETVDGFHGSEKAYLRLFINLAKADRMLREYSADMSYLEARLEATHNDLQVFDNGEY